MESFIQYAVYLIILVALAIPLGAYIGKVMNGEKYSFPESAVPVKS